MKYYNINKYFKINENNKFTFIEIKNTQYESVDMINNKFENSEIIDKVKLNTSKNGISF